MSRHWYSKLLPGYRRLLREGTPGQAVILSSEWKRFDLSAGRMAHLLTLEVHYDDGTTAQIVRTVSALEVGGTHLVGDVLPVRFDPADHANVEIDVPVMQETRRRERDELGTRRVEEARASLAGPGTAAPVAPTPVAASLNDSERLTAEWLEELVRLKLGHADGAVSDSHYQAGLTAARSALREGTAIRATGEEADFVAAVAYGVIGDPVAPEPARAAGLLEAAVRLKLRRESGELDEEQYHAAQAVIGKQVQEFD